MLTFEEQIKKVVYMAEATNFETHCLWKEHKDIWLQICAGSMACVGYVNKKPVCISLLVNMIEGEPVLFWHPTSVIVDYDMIEAYLKDRFPWLIKHNGCLQSTDAMNFHTCIHFIKDMKKKRAEEEHQTQLFRAECRRRQMINEMATEGLDIDEHGYVI